MTTLGRVALLLVAVAVLGPAPGSAAGAEPESTGTTVRATHHGIALSLHLPHRTYPRNALVRATVTVVNHTKRTVYFGAENPLNPNPSVTNVHGSPLGVALPPNYVSNAFTTDCTDFIHVDYGIPRAAPGEVYRTHPLVVLSGPWLVAGVAAEIGRLDGTGPVYSFHTPRLHLRLQDEPAPVLSLAAGSTPHLDVLSSPPASDAGPLLVEDWALSPSSRFTQWDGWHEAPGMTLTPACANPSRWHVLAGWLNHPVSEIEYSSPAGG